MTNETVKDILIPITSILVSAFVAYFTAGYALRSEYKHGQLRLLELIRRYCINVLNAKDPQSSKIKQDQLSRHMYVEELRSILEELGKLIANPYFAKLIVQYPLLSKALVQMRREFVEHGCQGPFAMNKGTMKNVNQLYCILLRALPKETNNEVDRELTNWLKNEVA